MNPDNEKIINELTEKLFDTFWNLIELTRPITQKHISEYEAKWPISEQYLKIHEETTEAYKGFKRNLVGYKEEHLDIFFSLLTLFHFHDFSKEDIKIEIKNCLVKFHQRSWI